MRIGTNTKYENILLELNRLSSEINKTQIKIATGKKYLKPSDDPTGIVVSLNYKQGIARINKYQGAIEEGLSFLKAQEAVLGNVQDLITRVKILAIQSANATQEGEARIAIANEIDSILEALLSLSNSQIGEKYIFGGNKTSGYSSGEKPFELVKEFLPDGQIIEKVVYNGSLENYEIGFDKDLKMELGKNGQIIFMDSGLFETLISLKKSLKNNLEVDYHKENYDIQFFIGKLDEIYNYINFYRGEIGAKINHLETKKTLYEDFKSTLETLLGEREGADLAELATNLQRLTLAYEAALKATVMVTDLSLVKFF